MDELHITHYNKGVCNQENDYVAMCKYQCQASHEVRTGYTS